MADAAKRIEAVARWLRLFIQPGQLTELRALNCVAQDRTVSGWFDYDSLELMAKQAVHLAKMSSGVYFVPNPINPEAEIPGLRKLGRNKYGEAWKDSCTADAHIARRLWLLIDADAKREDRPRTMATAEQRDCAWKAIDQAKAILETAGYGRAVIGDSGNGWHLCQPIDMPNDDAAREKCQRLLKGLEKKCGSEGAEIDTSTFNAARIWRIYGTENQKGKAT